MIPEIHLRTISMCCICLFVNLEKALAEPPMYKVLSATTLSLDSDARGRAVLVAGEDGEADLYVYEDIEGDDETPSKIKAPSIYKNVAFNSTFDEASLSLNSKYNLVINSGHESVGRDKWSQQLTVAWRKDALYVIGVTFNERDSLDSSVSETCDLNLLTGRGMKNGRPTLAPSPIPLNRWKSDEGPAPCG